VLAHAPMISRWRVGARADRIRIERWLALDDGFGMRPAARMETL
jgi:hypothetical protein